MIHQEYAEEKANEQALASSHVVSAPKRIPLNSAEKRGVVLLLILYTIQGLPLGFFGGAVQLLLTAKGIKMVQLAELAVVFYPFTFKFILAPIQDAYYNHKFGKRKSYIVPLQYLLALLFFTASFEIEILLDEKNIEKLIIYGFIACLIVSQQDVAVDGWVLTIFEKEEHVNLGTTCNTIGQTLGMLIANGLFVQLNSVEFCNSFIYLTPSDTPLITASSFLMILAVVVFTVTLVVQFFIPEREKAVFESSNDNLNASCNQSQDMNNSGNRTNLVELLPKESQKGRQSLEQSKQTDKYQQLPSDIQPLENKSTNDVTIPDKINEDQQIQSNQSAEHLTVMDVLRRLKGFITNKNLRGIVFFLLTYGIGLSTVSASLGVKLIQAGMKKEAVSSLSSFMIPLSFVAAVLASKAIKPHEEFSAWRKIVILSVINTAIGYFLVQFNPVIDNSNSSQVYFIMFLYLVVSTVVGTFRGIALGGFYNRIADEDIGGSSLTTLNSISNLGGQLTEQVSLLALEFMSYSQLVGFGIVYSLGYVLIVGPKLIYYQTLPKAAWSLQKNKHQ